MLMKFIKEFLDDNHTATKGFLQKVLKATMIDLKEQFSNCDLVFKVDICEWADLDDDFKKSIENELVFLI